MIKIILLSRPVSKAVLYDELVALNKSNRKWVNGFDQVLCTLPGVEMGSCFLIFFLHFKLFFFIKPCFKSRSL